MEGSRFSSQAGPLSIRPHPTGGSSQGGTQVAHRHTSIHPSIPAALCPPTSDCAADVAAASPSMSHISSKLCSMRSSRCWLRRCAAGPNCSAAWRAASASQPPRRSSTARSVGTLCAQFGRRGGAGEGRHVVSRESLAATKHQQMHQQMHQAHLLHTVSLPQPCPLHSPPAPQ